MDKEEKGNTFKDIASVTNRNIRASYRVREGFGLVNKYLLPIKYARMILTIDTIKGSGREVDKKWKD